MVDVGEGADLVAASLAPYLVHRSLGRSFCLLKTAMSLDGRIAAADGTSQWITGPEARADAHIVRSKSQAVVIGAGTALADRPTLTARDVDPPVEHQPLRVLLDARGRVPAEGPLFDTDLAPTLVLTTDAASDDATAPGSVRGPRCSRCRRPASGTGVDLRKCWRRLPAWVCCRRCSKAARRSRARCSTRSSSTARSPTSRRGARPRRGPRVRDHRAWPRSPTPRRWKLIDVARLGEDVRLTYEPAPEAGLMFTGIVEELGVVRRIDKRDGGARIEITAKQVLEDAEIGASISVSGCCLTVVELGPDWWAADAVTETLDRTCLGALTEGDPVNLERPVRLADRLGGHIVQGHVDAVGHASRAGSRCPTARCASTSRPRRVTRYVVEKGSITVDGISLTVAELTAAGFAVAVIPHTLEVTTLGTKQAERPRKSRSGCGRQVRGTSPRAQHRTGRKLTKMPFTKIETGHRRDRQWRPRGGRRRRRP